MYKMLLTLLFIFSTLLIAKDDTYVFEAKGEFAKELKTLVEKYSKEGKIEAKVYKKEDMTKKKPKPKPKTILSIFTDDTAEKLKYADVNKGKKLYQKECASCHGVKADNNKYANARKLSTLNPLEIVELLEGYRENYNGKFGGSLRTIMQPQVDSMLSEEMQSIAVYIYSLNHDTKLPILENSTQVEEEKEVPASYLQ